MIIHIKNTIQDQTWKLLILFDIIFEFNFQNSNKNHSNGVHWRKLPSDNKLGLQNMEKKCTCTLQYSTNLWTWILLPDCWMAHWVICRGYMEMYKTFYWHQYHLKQRSVSAQRVYPHEWVHSWCFRLQWGKALTASRQSRICGYNGTAESRYQEHLISRLRSYENTGQQSRLNKVKFNRCQDRRLTSRTYPL